MVNQRPSKPWHLTVNGLRWVTLTLPPLALVLLWLTPKASRREKLLGSVGIPLCTIPYAVVALWGLHNLFGIDWYEWRGGYVPVITLYPTQPDYDALEANRRAHPAGVTSPVAPPVASPGWAGFRGSHRDGVYSGPPLNLDWTKHPPRLVWRQPVGGGYASFAIAQELAFTLEQRRDQEVVAAYDLATGRERWTHGWTAEFQEPIGGNGPRATPTWHDNRLYALGADGELRCLQAHNGALVWRRQILQEHNAPRLEYGCAGSPLVVGDVVVVTPGGAGGQSVAAFDRRTGEVRWSVLEDRQAYVSPTLATLAGESQLIIVSAKRTVGLAFKDGALLWDFAWGEPLMGRNVAQPVTWDDKNVLLSAGYDTGSVALEVRHLSSGWRVQELWRNKLLKNKFTSSVYWQGHLYGLDEDILTCLDAATGARRWKDGRYGYGQLVLAEGHLIVLCGNGDLALVRANPVRHQEVARFPGLQGKTWNHPAISRGLLLVRNAAEMACFDLSPAP